MSIPARRHGARRRSFFALPAPTPQRPNLRGLLMIEVHGNIALVPLARTTFTIIDASDVALVEGRNWFAHRRGMKWYARNSDKVYLHRLLLAPRPGYDVDHVNGNGLDNRRPNIRECTHAENCANFHSVDPSKTSKYKGVSFHKRSGRWRAEICKQGARTELGRFKSDIEAALAYDIAAKQLFGEFALLNFPGGADVVLHANNIARKDGECPGSRMPIEIGPKPRGLRAT